jgi:hypothetical protein
MIKYVLIVVIILLIIYIVHLLYRSNRLLLKSLDLELQSTPMKCEHFFGSIPIYYINLDRDKDRKTNIEQMVRRFNVSTFLRIEGVIGNDIQHSHDNIYTVKGRDITFYNNFPRDDCFDWSWL